MAHVMKNKSQLKQSTFYSHKFNKKQGNMDNLDKTLTVLNY